MTKVAESRHRQQRSESGTETPIVNQAGRIIGWTNNVPFVDCGRVRHPLAESLLDGPVTCTYVQVSDRADARRAGAPLGWSEPWRCLAFVPDRTPESRSARF